ncbi:AbrB/MazE/SpoVT family DNA-binding domain-containing protein [Oscillospiraceae bacterium OttesenSCG-928-G22]|nr:AbrB/MazE/SpoVT family DNA-binding domain-containing protein [Oscillospiraceae bacterium OttesenSCG-928-G22]
MSKAIFKVIDDKGRVVIPAPIRSTLGLSPGDIVGVAVSGGRVSVKKAIVLEDERMPLDARQAYAETVMRELPPDRLAEVLELVVRRLKELSPTY